MGEVHPFSQLTNPVAGAPVQVASICAALPCRGHRSTLPQLAPRCPFQRQPRTCLSLTSAARAAAESVETFSTARSVRPDARRPRSGQTIHRPCSRWPTIFRPLPTNSATAADQQESGPMSPEAAMRGLALRTGILEMKIFVLAVMVHNQTGGNLAELLDRLSTVIRDRYKIRGSIQALTAEGRMQMMILLALPPLMLAVLMVLNRPYASILFDYPNVLFGTAASMGLSALCMASIVNFDFSALA